MYFPYVERILLATHALLRTVDTSDVRNGPEMDHPNYEYYFTSTKPRTRSFQMAEEKQ